MCLIFKYIKPDIRLFLMAEKDRHIVGKYIVGG